LNSAGTRLGWLPLLTSPLGAPPGPAIFLAALRGRKAAMQYVPTRLDRGECRNQLRPNSLNAFRKRDTLLRPLNNPLRQEATEQGKEAVVLDMNSVSFRDFGLELARRGNPRLCASTQRR